MLNPIKIDYYDTSVLFTVFPSGICWSGNPIYYKLYSPAAAADSKKYFEFKIMFKRGDESIFRELYRFIHVPEKGWATFSIHEVIDSALEHEVPADNGTAVYPKKNTGLFYISFKIADDAEQMNYFWPLNDTTPTLVVKGGMSYEKWRGDNYWINYFAANKPFLTWQLPGRLALPKERMFLSWLNTTDVDPMNISVKVTVTYKNGSSTQNTFPFQVQKNRTGYIPCGYEQLNLHLLEDVYTWGVTVVNSNGDPLSAEMLYELDNRPDYNNIILYYRNSLGGIDSVAIRGVIEYSANRKFTNSEIATSGLYYDGVFLNGRIKTTSSTEWIVKKGDVGYMDAEEHERIRDIHFSRECWHLDNSKWVPVVIMTEDEKLKSTSETLWSLPIIFAIASNGDQFYTPDLPMGEGSEFMDLTYEAEVEPTGIYADPLTFEWQLVKGTADKYIVKLNDLTPVTTTNLSQAFYDIPEGEGTITITPVRIYDGVDIIGKPTTRRYFYMIPLPPPGIYLQPYYL